MANNLRTRQIYQFIAVSGAGKRQSAFGAFQPNTDIDTREKCTVAVSGNVSRNDQYDCDGVDLIREAIASRDCVVTLTYDDGFTPQQAARWLSYKLGAAAAPTGATVNEVQTLTRTGTVSGGTFTISFTHEGKTGTTEAIAFDASNAAILAALIKKTGIAGAMGKVIKPGDVAVSGTWATAITLTFTGRLAAANIANVTINTTALTGTTPGITVAESTAGDQKFHAITRSTDGTLPLFSFILGDRNGAYDYFKYGDAVVESVNFTSEQAAGALVKMTVVIYCNFTPSREAVYTVPACVNITPLKVEDCKVKISGNFETADAASFSAVMSNNIPREAAFAFDDIDVTNAYQRGDRPTQNFTLALYGAPSTALYRLAEAEETDGNATDFTFYLGQMGNRVTIAGANTKIKFAAERLGFAGALRQSVINIEATPYGSPPLVYSASVPQATAFLTSS